MTQRTKGIAFAVMLWLKNISIDIVSRAAPVMVVACNELPRTKQTSVLEDYVLRGRFRQLLKRDAEKGRHIKSKENFRRARFFNVPYV
jgi:hypothetical protein